MKIDVVIPTLPSHSHETVTDRLRNNQTRPPDNVIVVNDADKDICEARNHGIRQSDAEVVALTDDDTQPPEGWVAAIERAFILTEDLVIAEGPVWGGHEYNGSRQYFGGNIAFDREVALSIGGFDSRYAGWRDDTEFGWRMEEEGAYTFWPTMKMHHPPMPRSEIDKNLETLLQAEYPEKYDTILVPDSIPGKVNFMLWRAGFWDLVDKVRA